MQILSSIATPFLAIGGIMSFLGCLYALMGWKDHKEWLSKWLMVGGVSFVFGLALVGLSYL